MAHRKEVFQSKVLQKLYPASSKAEKEPSPPNLVEALAKKTHVKRKVSGEDSTFKDEGKTQCVAKPGSRVYTVLPPPADYIHSMKSVTLPQREGINSAEDPAEESNHESTEELNEEKNAAGQKRRRRRRKKKKMNSALQQDFEDDGSSPVREPSTGQSQTPMDEGGGHISRNKKRKLKKKRHKEKLLSMGLMPRAAALEFTYQKDGEEATEEEEEDDEERRVAEVSDFLKSVMEICLSDSSLQVVRSPHLSSTVDDLLRSIESGCKPNSVLTKLYNLKVLAQHNDADKLEKALKELSSISAMSAEETTAVVSLFQYWITDILPMQRDKKTSLSTTNL